LATMKKKPLRVLFSLFCVRSLLLAYRCLCVSTYFSISHLNIIYIHIHKYEKKKDDMMKTFFFVFSICLYFFSFRLYMMMVCAGINENWDGTRQYFSFVCFLFLVWLCKLNISFCAIFCEPAIFCSVYLFKFSNVLFVLANALFLPIEIDKM
jgi:hypothetical protein